MTFRVLKTRGNQVAKWTIAKGTIDQDNNLFTKTDSVDFLESSLDNTRQGIVKRLDPDNFQKVAGYSNKYDLGLLDLSASLLDPKRKIATQIYKTQDPCQAVFMPVPLKEDAAMFYRLNEIAKKLSGRSWFLFLMRRIKGSMTRIKLAQEDDMHTAIVQIDKGDGRVHYRYGITGSTMDRTPQGQDSAPEIVTEPPPQTPVFSGAPPPPPGGPPPLKKKEEGKLTPLSAETLKKRIEDRVRYENLFRGEGYNEIVLAYRSHGNPEFPIFVDWPGSKKMGANETKANTKFQVVDHAGVAIQGRFVTNEGKLVKT